MPHLLLFGAAIVVLVLIISKVFAPSLEAEAQKVIDGGDLNALLESLAKRSEAAQPNAYNRVIRRLWDAYQREKAIPLVRALVEKHGEAQIAQYWLQQVRTVEPELAQASFDEAFLAAHHRPEVAATCGPVG